MAKTPTKTANLPPNSTPPERRVKLSIVSGLLFIAIIAVMLFFVGQEKQQHQATTKQSPAVINQEKQAPIDQLSYQGQTGKDALTLLKQTAIIEQDPSGLVVSINGRKADNSKHEFWAFLVNGKEATVGPADYQTKDGDQIEWKIATY